MRISTLPRIMLLIVMMMLVIGAMTAQEDETALIPPEITDEDWALAHHNYGNTRNAVSSTISATNVDALDVAWTLPLATSAEPGETLGSPLVSDNTVYFQDNEGTVHALQLEDGNLVWEQPFDVTTTGANGPGIGYEQLYVVTGANTVSALDLSSGEEIWTFETPDERPIGAVQPYAFGEQVYVTSSTGDSPGTSGYVYALDAATGEVTWEFQVVEAGFWGNPDVNGGGNLAFPPAIDTNRDLVIWGTGSPTPAPGIAEFPNATSRTEPNLYTNSVVAVDPLTGDLKWHNHVNPDDLFNLGVDASPILSSITMDDETQDIVIGSGAFGEVVAMDRLSGEELWRTAVGEHRNDDITTVPEGVTVTVLPGMMGGVSSPMAFAEGIIYAPVLNLSTAYTADTMQATQPGTGTSELVALDATSGIILWSQDFETEIYSGATVVNDLVFTATSDGLIYAFDRLTGEEILSYQAPAGINGAPAVVGDTMLFPAGLGNSPALIALRVFPEQIVQEQGMAVPPPPEAETEGEEMADMGHGDMAEATPQTSEDTIMVEPTVAPTAIPQILENAISDPTQYITLGEGEQVVDLNVISSVGGYNDGLNFNGYFDGAVIVNVPEGWTVNVNFENRSNFPHSVAVVPVEMAMQRNVGEPAFEGAATEGAQAGIIGSATFTFVAGEQGEYALACAVPSHSLRGQWWYFNVIGADEQPSVQIANSDPYIPGQ